MPTGRKKEEFPLFSKRTKFAALAVALTVTSSALFGGALAAFTDSKTTQAQVLTSGTVDIDLENSVNNVKFEVPIRNVVPGDTFIRFIDVRNAGNLPLQSLRVSQTNGGGEVITNPMGLQVKIDACSTAWNENTCSGTLYENAMAQTVVGGWNTITKLEIPALAPDERTYLRVSAELPNGFPNEGQSSDTFIRYSFNGIQRNPVSNGENGVPIEVNPDLPAVAASTLTGELVEDGQAVSLSWTSAANADFYRLERTTTPQDAKSWTSLKSGAALTYKDSSVEPGTAYTYRVIGINNDQLRQKASNQITITTSMEAGAVTLRKKREGTTATAVSLGWNRLAGATTTTLARSSTEAMDNPVTQTLAAGSADQVVNDLTPGALYYFQVTQAGPGRTVKSNVLAVRMDLDAPDLTLTARTKSSLTLKFSGASGAQYLLYSADDRLLYEGASTSFTVNGLATASAYTFKLVQTKDGSSGSVTKTFTTAISNGSGDTLPASALTVEDFTDSSVSFTWAAVAGATSYRLESAPSDTFASEIRVEYQGAGRSFTVTGLAPYTTRAYRLVAVNEPSDTEIKSVPLTATTRPLPQTVAATSGAEIRTARVTWNASPISGVQYELQMSASQNGSYSTVGTYSGTSATVENLDEGTYWFRLVTKAPLASSVPSTPVSAVVNGLGTATISSVTTAPGTTTTPQTSTATVNRSDAAGAQSYKTYYRAKGATAWTEAPAATFTLPASAEYQAMVRAFGPGGITKDSTPYDFISAPSVDRTASTVTYDRAADRFVYSFAAALPSGSNYRLERSNTADFAARDVIYTGRAGTTPVTIANRVPDYTYFRAIVVDRFGQEVNDTAWSGKSLTPPVAPANVNTVKVNATTFTVSWSPSAGATGYRIRSTGANAAVLYNAPGTSHTLTVQAGQVNEPFEIEAFRTVQVGANSETIYGPISTFAVQGDVSAPTLSVNPDTNALSASWTSVARATSYRLERADSATMANATTLSNGVARTYSDSSVELAMPYYYRVTVTGENGTTATSAVVQATLPLPAISITPGTTSFNSLAVSWSQPPRASSYTLTYATSEDFANAVVTTIPSGSTVTTTLTGLATGTRYYYKIQGFQANGKPASLVSLTASSVTKAPATIFTYKDSDWSTGRIDFTRGSGPAGLMIEESTDDGTTWTQAGTSDTAGTYSLSGRNPATTYTYRNYRVATDGVTRVGESAPFTVKIQPDAAANINAVNNDPPLISHDGTPTGASGVQIYRKLTSDPDSAYVTVPNSLTGASYSDTTASEGKSYIYRLRSIGTNGAVRDAFTRSNVLSLYKRATNFTATAVSSSTISLSWTNASAVCTNMVLTRAPEGGSSEVVGTFTNGQTSYTDTSGLPNSLYNYQIAYNCDAAYTTSASAQGITLPAAVTNIETTSTSTTGIGLRWVDPYPPQSYTAVYSVNSDFSNATTRTGISASGTTVFLSGLTSSTRYYIKIISVGRAGTAETNYVESTNLPGTLSASYSFEKPASRVDSSDADIKVFSGGTSGPTSYRLEIYNPVTTPTPQDLVTSKTSTTLPFFTDSVLQAQTSYKARLVGIADNGSKIFSTFTTTLSSAPRFDDFTAASNRGRLDPTWTPNAGTESATIYYAESPTELTSSGAIYNNPVGPSSSTTAGPVAVPGDTYYVAAYIRNVAVTNVVTYTMPIAPARVTAVNTNGTTTARMTVSWSAVSGASSYRVRRTATTTYPADQAVPATTGTPLATVTTTSYLDTTTPATGDTQFYTYSVEAVFANGTSSAPASTSINQSLLTTIAAPTYTTNNAVRSNATITWAAYAGTGTVANYRVRCGVAQGATWNTPLNVQSRSTAITSTVASTVRTYSADLRVVQNQFRACAVEAVNSAGTRLGVTPTTLILPTTLKTFGQP